MKTARVHHAARRRGGGVAARGARAAAGDAGDRVSQQLSSGHQSKVHASVPAGPERGRFFRGPQRYYRISLGRGGPIRSIADDGSRSRWPASGRARSRARFLRPSRQRRRRPPFQSYSRLAAIPSRPGWSSASTGPAGMLPAQLSCPWPWGQNGWNCCAISCPKSLQWVCS